MLILYTAQLILYTAQSCSTAGEVISTALYCKHWCYFPGPVERATLIESLNYYSDQKQMNSMCLQNHRCRNPKLDLEWSIPAAVTLGHISCRLIDMSSDKLSKRDL